MLGYYQACDYNLSRLLFQRRTLDSGTTTACYFGTIHKEACKILADEANEKGQRAFIGKVAMNQYSPDTYVWVQGRLMLYWYRIFIYFWL